MLKYKVNRSEITKYEICLALVATILILCTLVTSNSERVRIWAIILMAPMYLLIVLALLRKWNALKSKYYLIVSSEKIEIHYFQADVTLSTRDILSVPLSGTKYIEINFKPGTAKVDIPTNPLRRIFLSLNKYNEGKYTLPVFVQQEDVQKIINDINLAIYNDIK